MMLDIQTPEAPEAIQAARRPVALSPVTLFESYRTVREIFFPDWTDRFDWQIEMGSGKPWLFCCEFDRKVLSVNKAHYAERDELRSILITLMCIARLGAPRLARLGDTIRKLEKMAAFIHRPSLAGYLGDARHTIASCRTGAKDVDIQWGESAVTFLDWPAAPIPAGYETTEYDLMLDDSLRNDDIKRILEVERRFIRGSD